VFVYVLYGLNGFRAYQKRDCGLLYMKCLCFFRGAAAIFSPDRYEIILAKLLHITYFQNGPGLNNYSMMCCELEWRDCVN
jgi:hypothetical protein